MFLWSSMSFYAIPAMPYTLCCYVFPFLLFSFAFGHFRALLVYKLHVDYLQEEYEPPYHYRFIPHLSALRSRLHPCVSRSATVPRLTSTTDLPVLDSRPYRACATDSVSRF